MKRVVFTILLVLWMSLIFMFSNQDGVSSQGTSDMIVVHLVDILDYFKGNTLSESVQIELIDNVSFFVRKTAHFTLYFILGILTYFTFKSYGMEKRLLFYSILFCFLYACSDEVHQLFSAGRLGRFFDVMIDTFGSALSIMLFSYICKNQLIEGVRNETRTN